MPKIKQVYARVILNGKGQPAIEATVILDNDYYGIASSPAGTSVGTYEAVSLYDKDPLHFKGRGVFTAIQNIQEFLAPKLIGMEATKQQVVDRAMIEIDGTQNKSRIGANAILAVSRALAKAAAASSGTPLFLYLRNFLTSHDFTTKIPTPMFNLLNGGIFAPRNLDFQDFLIIPTSSTPYGIALEMGLRAYEGMKEVLVEHNFPTLIADEGGFSPQLPVNQDAIILALDAAQRSSLRIGFEVFLGIDCAATQFHEGQQYKIKDHNQPMQSKALNDYYVERVKQYHILYLEDPLSEDDWDGWVDLTQRLGKDIIISGDDLTATNPYRLQMAIDKRAITGITVKPSQVGTTIEALALVEVARAAGLKVTVASRSGETNDDFIADFAVAVGADYVKFGSPARGEHVAKYNRLLQIDSQIKNA
ncbi:MAG: phosphopyruvate hydratase [Patescibacteria group bacterium]|nr:phosphopyruvate hydratase [Patescibacteria group bacterium]